MNDPSYYPLLVPGPSAPAGAEPGPDRRPDVPSPPPADDGGAPEGASG